MKITSRMKIHADLCTLFSLLLPPPPRDSASAAAAPVPTDCRGRAAAEAERGKGRMEDAMPSSLFPKREREREERGEGPFLS